MLDRETAERLWDEKIQPTLLGVAHKYYWLDDLQDPLDLFQDLAVDVWLPTVEKFDMGKVTYTKDIDRAVYSMFQTRLTNKIRDLVKSYNREVSKTKREMERLDRPVGDFGTPLEELIPSEEDLERDAQTRMDFESMMAGIDPTLEDILRFVISWDELPGTLRRSRKALWDEVESRWGMTRDEIFNSLSREPVFMTYINTNVGKESLKSAKML